MAEEAQFVEGCGVCRANRGEIPAPGGVIYGDALWRLEHAFEPIPLAGWLVLRPLRHVESFADLNEREAAAVGPLIQRVTAAMRDALQPAKIYVCQFSEAEGFAHIHIHLIPRSSDTPSELRGPSIFDLLGRAIEEQRNLADVAEAANAANQIRELL